MEWTELYKSKLRGSREIAEQIQPKSVCVSTAMCGEPREILQSIADRAMGKNEYGVEHHSLLSFHKHDLLKPEMQHLIKHVSWFTSGYSRKAVQEGRADYMPTYYKDVPKLWESFLEADVFYALVSPMDQHGYFSFGLSCSESLAAKEKAKRIFLEVNPNMPRTHGQNFIHISEVDLLCESSYPIPELMEPPIGELDRMIGNYVAEEIPNGSTIQLGIGGIPNAVGRALLDKRDLGIHSEMFVESFIDLIEAGVVNNRVKAINKGKSITTFAAGSKRLYDFLHDNPSIDFRPVDYVNDPMVIAAHQKMMSINSCIEVDLLGQVCSESMGKAHYSGSGGQVDFVRGATQSAGGRSFIAMHATAKGGTLSKIKPLLTPGSVVTTSKNDVDTIVTEFGKARLKGKTAGQRAKVLIEIAHPEFREELEYQARKMNLMI